MKNIILGVVVFAMGMCTSCGNCDCDKLKDGEWIRGSDREQIKAIERQFRGFDMAMAETGYRYTELYWAGIDENWGYAEYQTEKIRKAIENGLERRPKRAKSAQQFLNAALPEMKKAVAQKDSLAFAEGYKALTAACNSCHAMEDVAFFEVSKPESRISPIKKGN